MEAVGFAVPGPEWELRTVVKKNSLKIALVSSPDGCKKQKVEVAPEDEIDEEEQLDQQLNIVGLQRHARFGDNDYNKCIGIEDWGDR